MRAGVHGLGCFWLAVALLLTAAACSTDEAQDEFPQYLVTGRDDLAFVDLVDEPEPAVVLGYGGQRSGSIEVGLHPDETLGDLLGLWAPVASASQPVDLRRGGESVEAHVVTDRRILLAQLSDDLAVIVWDYRQLPEPEPGHDPADFDWSELAEVVAALEPVSEQEWERALAVVDVAPPWGRIETELLIQGDGWELVGVLFRPPRTLARRQIELRVPGLDEDSGLIPLIVSAELYDAGRGAMMDVSTARIGGEQVVFGAAPLELIEGGHIDLRFSEGGRAEAPAVSYAGVAAFAVAVPAHFGSVQLQSVE